MIICSYHSNLYFDSFKSHVREIKEKGFDTILFCITETDILYNLPVFKEFKDFAESEGLVCWATFWGLTAGEAICRQTDEMTVRKWLSKVCNIGFKNIMIDEPKKGFDIAWFLRLNNVFAFHVCLTDDTFKQMSDEEIKEMPVQSVGVSNYHWVKDWMKITSRTETIAKRLHSLRPHDNFVFLQGFDIPDGWEDIPVVVKDICKANGIVNFGVWSFRATITGTKRSANPEKVWNNICFPPLSETKGVRGEAATTNNNN